MFGWLSKLDPISSPPKYFSRLVDGPSANEDWLRLHHWQRWGVDGRGGADVTWSFGGSKKWDV